MANQFLRDWANEGVILKNNFILPGYDDDNQLDVRITRGNLFKKMVLEQPGDVDYSCDNSEDIIIFSGMTTGSICRLPYPDANNIGKEMIIKNLNDTDVSVTITVADSSPIDRTSYGAVTIALPYGQSMTLVFDGAGWIIAGQYAGSFMAL